MAFLWIGNGVRPLQEPSARGAVVRPRSTGWLVALPAVPLGLGRRCPPTWTGPFLTLSVDILARFHCQIAPREGAFWIRDEGSTGGLAIGDRRVHGPTFHRLQHGDRLFLLDVVFLEHLDDPTTPSALGVVSC
jgi:hypothetical protein